MRALLTRIEGYLKRTGTAPTRFGRDVLNDPRFVFDLRYGRRAGPEVTSKVTIWLNRRERRRRV